MQFIRKEFVLQIKKIINQARQQAIRSVDFERVLMYWHIGKSIFEEEQNGKERADYGVYLIKLLAKELDPQFGIGFSGRQLELCRQFYRIFPIANALSSQLGWTHYRLLIRLDSNEKREYYMLECVKNNRHLENLNDKSIVAYMKDYY